MFQWTREDYCLQSLLVHKVKEVAGNGFVCAATLAQLQLWPPLSIILLSVVYLPTLMSHKLETSILEATQIFV